MGTAHSKEKDQLKQRTGAENFIALLIALFYSILFYSIHMFIHNRNRSKTNPVR